MGDKSNIEWTDATWNPVTGCTKVSAGCKHCYAERWFPRVYGDDTVTMHEGEESWLRQRKFTDVKCHPERLDQPLRWRKPRRVFVNSMSDLFHEHVPDDFIDCVFAVMALAPQHTFQVLTKRPERMRAYIAGDDVVRRICEQAAPFLDTLPHSECGKRTGSIAYWVENGESFEDCDPWPLPNVWLGVSCEDQPTADERTTQLLKTPAAVRFISAEPLLGPVDLDSEHAEGLHALGCGEKSCECGDRGLDWVIAGGESGPHARPMHPDWARSLRDQCQAASVPFFFKQWGEWAPGKHVDRQTGSVDGAHWFDDRWLFDKQWLGSTDGHIDDEPDLYRVGKRAAGRLLDGRVWNGMPVNCGVAVGPK